MGLYAKYLLPRVVDFACRQKPTMRQREKVVPLARGRVVEIGIGSGLNLPFYDPRNVEQVWGVDPSARMWNLAGSKDRDLGFGLRFVEGSAEDLPLENDCADTVLVTYSLCTIPDVPSSLAEIRRVLRPEGALIFCEHGEAPDHSVQRWQRWANPLWRRIGGGCHLNRPIPKLLEQANFRIDTLETMYLPGWKAASFNYWGQATPN